MSEIKVLYNDVEIEYDENTNLWVFELRGRARHAKSLADAKVAVDKVPAAKRKPFPAFEAWKMDWNNEMQPVRVTSFAGLTYNKTPEWWITWTEKRDKYSGDKDRRAKEPASRLYVQDEENRTKIREIKCLRDDIRKLQEKILLVVKSMKNIPEPTKDMLE